MIDIKEVEAFINTFEGTSYSPDKAALIMWNFVQDKLRLEETQRRQEAENRREYERNKQMYNGWRGDGTHAGAYATWAVSMWFSGPAEDEYLHDLMKEHGPTVDHSMSEAVENYILPMITEEEFNRHYEELNGCLKDLVGYMTSGINWYELCEHWIDEVEFDPCPICGKTDCLGAQDVEDCDDYEECDICGDWDCEALKTGQDSDCLLYEEPRCEICGSELCDGKADPDWCTNKDKEADIGTEE